MNWSSLSVTVMVGVKPIENLVVTFVMANSDKTISFSITAVTDSNGIATVSNSALNSYVKYDKSSRTKTVTNNSDFDFENLASWYVTYELDGVTTNSASQTITSGANTVQSSPRATAYSTYKVLKITSSTSSANVRCFFYNSNDDFLGKLSVITDNNCLGEIELAQIDGYETIKYIKFNAYRNYGANDCLVYHDTVFNDIDNGPFNAITFTYEDDFTICAFIQMTLQYGNQFNVHIGNFIACDYLAKHTGNICPIYSNTNLYIKNGLDNSQVWSGETIWTSIGVNADYTTTGRTLIYEAIPNFYNSGYTTVDIFDYPYNSHHGFLLTEVFVVCLKKEYELRLPRVLDTAKIRDTIQFPTPIYNLRDTTIIFLCPLKSGQYMAELSSNDEYIIFNASEIGPDYEEVINKIALVEMPQSLSDVPTFKLKKHHYLDVSYYAIAGSETFFVDVENEHYTNCDYFFVDYQLADNVPATAYTATSLYNLARGASRSGGDSRPMIRYVNWSDYTDSPILPLPYEMVYMVIKREKYVCPREKELDDYMNGFSYNETGTIYTALTNFNLTGHSEFADRTKLYVAKESFLNACGNKVGSGNMPLVPQYKQKFVGPYLNKGTRYGTDYTKRDLYDSYFLTDSASFSGHAYVFDTKKYTFYPKTDYPYLRFEKINNIGTETVKLTKIGNPANVSLLYSTSENLWFDYTLETPIIIPNGGYVEFKNKYEVTGFSENPSNYYHFSLEGNVSTRVLGNISSLLNPSAIGITVTSATPYLFSDLFSNEPDLVDAADLNLDINKVPASGYTRMFKDCVKLVSGPDIMAYSGSEWCFGHMFNGCSSMQTGPTKLFENADNLRTIIYPDYCCNKMFYECNSLVYGPFLEKSVTCRTEFGVGCFSNMFTDCESMKRLMNANEVKETTQDENSYIGGSYYDYHVLSALTTVDNSSILSEYSCYQMFAGCRSLIKSPKFEPCYVDNSSCFGMFSGCSSLIETYLHIDEYIEYGEETELLPGHVGEAGCAYMYIHCSSLKELGRIKLNATSLSEKSYLYMFACCTNIGGFIGGNETYSGDDDKKLPLIAATSIPPSGCAYMYYKCYGNKNNPNFLNQFINRKFTYVDNFGMAHMFDSCEYLDTYPIERRITYNSKEVRIKASSAECQYSSTSPTYDAFVYMPNSKLLVKYRNNQEELDNFKQIAWYSECNGDVPGLPTHFEITDTGANVTYTTYDIEINASSLADSCYAYMFTECNHLHYANHIILPEKTLAQYSYDHMFYNCDELFAIPMLSAVTTINTASMRSMFEECSAVKPDNKLQWWSWTNAFVEQEYDYYNVVSYADTDGNGKSMILPYYLCKRGLFSIQKKYFYPINTDGRFEWNVDENGYGYNGTYVVTNGSGIVQTWQSTAYRLTITSTASSMSYKSWELGGTSHTLNFVGASGMSCMFKNCYGLTYPYFKVVTNTLDLPDYTFSEMFANNYSMQYGFRVGFDADSKEIVSVERGGFYKMFYNCFEARETFLENRSWSELGHALRPNNLGHASLTHMYQNCYKLRYGPRIIATGLSESCCAHMFNGCWRLKGLGVEGGSGVNNPVNAYFPATTLAKKCYYAMFFDCHSLVFAPRLIAPQAGLRESCYEYMFSNASLRYFNFSLYYKFRAAIRHHTTSNPFYISSSIDGRTYSPSSDKNDNEKYLPTGSSARKKVFVKGMGNEYYYFLHIQEEATEWISLPKIINLSDDAATVAYLDTSLISRMEPENVIFWGFGNTKLYVYDNTILEHTGYVLKDVDGNVIGVYDNLAQAEALLVYFPGGTVEAKTPYPIYYNNNKEQTINYVPSSAFTGLEDFAYGRISDVLGNGTRHIHSKNHHTRFETTTYSFSGAKSSMLYTTANELNGDVIYYYNYSNWQQMYNNNVLGGADKFAKWVPNGSSAPSGYKKFKNESGTTYNNVYVPNSLKIYKIRQQYEVISSEYDDDYTRYHENINLNASGERWDDKKYFKTPPALRYGSGYYADNDYDNFNIPLNNRSYSNMSLSAIYVSASTLSSTYSKGWTNGLKFIDGHLYAKSGGSIPTGNTNGCPENWTLHTN